MKPINKKTAITGLIALAAGLGIGVGASELKNNAPATGNAASTATNAPEATTAAANANIPGQAWDPYQQIRDMQMQMDNMFSQMSSQFRAEPALNGIAENPAYSLSLSVEDLKDRFVVRAFLPDTKAADASVKLDNQTLKVSVSNHQSSESNKKNTATRISEWGQYEQLIQLPAPVKAGKMQIERKDHELVITLPKE